MKAKFIVIGYGWRADFFYRVAKALPDKFEITAGVLRTPERAQEIREREGVFATHSLNIALKTDPDFAVVSLPKKIATAYIIQLMELGIPVLCETPPALTIDGLNELWKQKEMLNGKIQVLEQFFLQPYYSTAKKIIQNGYLGEMTSVMLSALHGYHGMSIFRKFLGVGFENCTVNGQKFTSNVTATYNRKGFDHSGQQVTMERDWGTLHFDSGKTAFFDFAGEQYFSYIRSRRWNLQGTRGEIDNMTVRFLNQDNIPIKQDIERIDVGQNSNSEWALWGMNFMGEQYYHNPFYPVRLNDDEIAVAECLTHMKEYVENGTEFYPLEEALQDTYLSCIFAEAINTGKSIHSTTQSWANNI